MIGLWFAVTNRLDYLLFQVCFFGMQNALLRAMRGRNLSQRALFVYAPDGD